MKCQLTPLTRHIQTLDHNEYATRKQPILCDFASALLADVRIDQSLGIYLFVTVGLCLEYGAIDFCDRFFVVGRDDLHRPLALLLLRSRDDGATVVGSLIEEHTRCVGRDFLSLWYDLNRQTRHSDPRDHGTKSIVGTGIILAFALRICADSAVHAF